MNECNTLQRVSFFTDGVGYGHNSVTTRCLVLLSQPQPPTPPTHPPLHHSRVILPSWTTQSSATSSRPPWRTKETCCLGTCPKSMNFTTGRLECCVCVSSSGVCVFYGHRVMLHRSNGTRGTGRARRSG